MLLMARRLKLALHYFERKIMITYLYFCPTHQEFELSHSINEEVKDCPKCQEEQSPIIHQLVRLINSQNGFILSGGCWARDKYSK